MQTPVSFEQVDKEGVRVCSRCVYDAEVPGISFDEAGVCNYCHLHDQMDAQFPTGQLGRQHMEQLANEIRNAGKGKKYDCVVGVSGGCDSSFLVVQLVELGLRPLAVHFDNTWNSPVSTRNIYNVLEKLGVDLFTHVVSNEEMDDIIRSFFKSGVKDLETPTDIALAATLYRAAERYGIKYVIEGHSFRTEGVAPLGWFYIDGKYIDSVHKRYGTLKMQTFPNMRLHDFLKWTAFKQIRRIRPLYYLQYQKAEAKQLLTEEYGWTWYGGHHLENRFTAFLHTYFLPRRFNIDTRLLGHAALVRSGQVTRDEAMAELAAPQQADLELVDMVKKRLNFSDREFEQLMDLPRKDYRDYPTYKQTFEKLRPLFWLLYKAGRVPHSFYVKFCFPWDSNLAERI